MSSNTLPLTPALLTYLREHSVKEHELLKALREETAQTFEAAPMQISPEQGQFFRFLLPLLGVKKALEIGTFTGYSAACFALALPQNGHLTCCDTSRDWTRLAEKYWHKMGLSDKITLHLAPALKTLNTLIDAGEENSFDFAFIDADKGNYLNYFEQCLKLVRPGGLIAIDNVLWDGEVINDENQNANTNAIRELNKTLYNDDRISLCIVPIGDGLTLISKK